MNTCLTFLFFLVVGTNISFGKNIYQTFDKAAFYTTMQSESVEEINDEVAKVEASSAKEKEAYKGALLMKKAGLLKKAKDKLRTFKEGGRLLETAISEDEDNAEYRFLRLTIQEHAPKILKYNKQIKNDSEFVKTHFKTLQPVVQQAIQDYAKTSKILHPRDFTD